MLSALLLGVVLSGTVCRAYSGPEGPIEHWRLEKAPNGDCTPFSMPKSWWDEVAKRNITYGTKDHLDREINAVMKMFNNSNGLKSWPEPFRRGWGDRTKACTWGSNGMNGQWQGLECHGGTVYSPPPPASTGSHIRSMLLGHGLVSGQFPEEFRLLVSMMHFEIPHSTISGTLFDTGLWIPTMTFDLASNKISGTIPNDFLPAPCLQNLDLSHNELSGTIPVSLGKKTVLYSLKLNDNQFTGTVPAFEGLPELVELDLSGNQLSGTIPPTLFKEAPKLKWLRLHSNKLTGPLPPTVVNSPWLSVISVAGNDGMDTKVPDEVASLPLRVFNGSKGMTCSKPDLLQHVPESNVCGGRGVGGSKATFISAELK